MFKITWQDAREALNDSRALFFFVCFVLVLFLYAFQILLRNCGRPSKGRRTRRTGVRTGSAQGIGHKEPLQAS